MTCGLLTCETTDDFLVYNLQNSAALNNSEVIPEPARCEPYICVDPSPDIERYNLQTNLVFSGVPLSIPITCPPGYNCNGTTVVLPPGDPNFPENPPNEPYHIEGCLSTIIGLSREATLAEFARQQAICDTIVTPPPQPPYFPPQPPVTTYTNDAVYFSHPCTAPDLLSYIGTLPAWISIDTATSRLVGAAGTFAATTKALANANAQAALNAFANAGVSSGALDCRGQYQNTLQESCCGADYVDVNNYSAAIDGTGIYSSGGCSYASPGYFFSNDSQAAADALALAAAQARHDALLAGEQVNCVHECLLMTWTRSETNSQPAFYSETGSSVANNRVVIGLTNPVTPANSGFIKVAYQAPRVCTAGKYRAQVIINWNITALAVQPNKHITATIIAPNLGSQVSASFTQNFTAPGNGCKSYSDPALCPANNSATIDFELGPTGVALFQVDIEMQNVAGNCGVIALFEQFDW